MDYDENMRIDDDDVYDTTEQQNKSEWENNYFDKFKWLVPDEENQEEDEDPISLDLYSIPQEERMKMFINCCGILKKEITDMLTQYEHTEDWENKPLYLYYVALDNDKLMLHADFKKENEEIIEYCEKIYEYVKVNKPTKIVYITEVNDLYDVDRDVKIYMNMFGIENTRGGSYSEIDIPEYLLKAIQHEQKITDMKYYIHRNKQNNKITK